ncbi:hypothetical protein MAPG_03575 [Magnaporthiopsis poae ATCC 64411]|uniref:Uncharacterized protein n=1 Tax=Magnaporthiopsis poae (strain ATCC 64411 / 73-15) TaxID=644358 RepID=A0A0C4DUD5_MAGP6|nr:hypothetical protein MAPG_03575 [Magnaporthiopsis poae ATCC 64411]
MGPKTGHKLTHHHIYRYICNSSLTWYFLPCFFHVHKARLLTLPGRGATRDMSGAEVAGIVIGIIGLYPLGEKLCKRVVKHFNSKDNRSKDGGQSKALEASLRHGRRSIKETYDRDFRRLGPKFARGDVIAQNALLRQRIRLDNLLISLLLDHINGKKSLPPNYRTLHDVSRSVRRGTISVLTELYQRQSQAAAPRRLAALFAPQSESESESDSNSSNPDSSDTDSESSDSEPESSSSRRNCRSGRIRLLEAKRKWKCCGCGWSCKTSECARFRSDLRADYDYKAMGRYKRCPHGYSTRDKQRAMVFSVSFLSVVIISIDLAWDARATV